MCQGYFQRLTAFWTSLLLLLGNVQWKEATTASQNLTVPAEAGHVIVLLANNDKIKKINMGTNESILILDDQEGVAALDYIYDSDLMFWTDVSLDLIQSVNLTTRYPINKVISTDIIEPEGIAVDWIYGHIYWTDSDADIIGVCDLQGSMRKTLFHTGLVDPIPIAVDPIDGWMFWADWGGAAKIERAGMDGCCRESIITTDILWPHGLCLDYEDKKMFWLDAKLGTLSTANYDGSERRAIIADHTVVHHSFGLDVLGDSVYWSDWKSKAIHRANKLTGQNVTSVHIAGYSLILGIKVYHPQRQPGGRNYCKSLSEQCSHFCFPTPRIAPTSPNITCACTNEKSLAEDGLNCIDQVTKR